MGMRTSGKTNSTPGWPNLHRTGPGREKHIKSGAKGLSLAGAGSGFLPLSLSPSLSPLQAGVLFSSSLWVNMPSHLEDGFSCYYLNKIVTQSCNTDLSKICNMVHSRPESYNMVCPRPESCDSLRALMSSKSLLWWDENRGAYTRLTTLCDYFHFLLCTFRMRYTFTTAYDVFTRMDFQRQQRWYAHNSA